ncbi:hypothetical protein KI387_022048 [Taxus chinensis]|uniref:Uncharacterized protein n=1 Tax=Taxus chinensis TaxID=29808 RepID=A0AA38GEY8_TAXCH|nr:hypothetical protein KI387_022048 [Taxus chinensis]
MDVLAWSYADLKSFKPKDVQHDIPLKEDAKAFCQKQRHYNPKISGHHSSRNSEDAGRKNYLPYPSQHLGGEHCAKYARKTVKYASA